MSPRSSPPTLIPRRLPPNDPCDASTCFARNCLSLRIDSSARLSLSDMTCASEMHASSFAENLAVENWSPLASWKLTIPSALDTLARISSVPIIRRIVRSASAAPPAKPASRAMSSKDSVRYVLVSRATCLPPTLSTTARTRPSTPSLAHTD